MTQDDNFAGAWLVTEYVFNPDGSYQGTVKQRRHLEQLDETHIRVTQQCTPATTLTTHAMANFAGEWVFDLTLTGDERHYLGPDVVGHAKQWTPTTLTATGWWPNFGYEFESYSVLVSPSRQLTGGVFGVAGRLVADIIGVAEPESNGVEPRLDLQAPLPEPKGEWHLRRSVGPMLLATAWHAPTTKQRLWAMHDPIGGTALELELTETCNGLSSKQVKLTSHLHG